MKRVSPYLKMRVLGAIEFAPGGTIVAKIRHVAGQVFTDDNDQRFQFTWRTIQTWYSRYKKDGITSMHPRARSDKGRTRKVEPETLAEAIDQVRANFRGNPNNVTAVYRACIERGLLTRNNVAPNTFRRIVKSYELLKPAAESSDKRRLAFAKAHANQMWQADTMSGPYVQHGGARRKKVGKNRTTSVWTNLRGQFEHQQLATRSCWPDMLAHVVMLRCPWATFMTKSQPFAKILTMAKR